MNTTQSSCLTAVLVSLFDLARDGRHAHMGSVAERLGLSRAVVVAALVELERRGLVDAARCRLTLPGLALAASLRASHGKRRRGGGAAVKSTDAKPANASPGAGAQRPRRAA